MVSLDRPRHTGRATRDQEGTIDVRTPDDAATLVYTLETVDGAGATSEQAGPFPARGQRVDEQLIAPTPE
jgi:hypothetical protein